MYGIGRGLKQSLGIKRRRSKVRRGYVGDAFSTWFVNTGFMNEPDFAEGWRRAEYANRNSPSVTPDIRWRAHLAVFAARHGLSLPGDFVECGVATGLLANTICHVLNFASVPKKLFLFDTFEGIPTATKEENAWTGYYDCYADVQESFAPFPNVELVRGLLPGSLSDVSLDRISYLSVDLNIAETEREVIEELWDRLSPSAMVVIDDYGWKHHQETYEVWNEFSSSKGTMVATLPTGQGLLIKPA